MSHLKNAYNLGAEAAYADFNKEAIAAAATKAVAKPGALSNIGKFFGEMAPETQAMLKQYGTGAAAGAIPGGILGGIGAPEGYGGTGMMLGALGGAGMGAAGGRVLGRSMRQKYLEDMKIMQNAMESQKMIGQKIEPLLRKNISKGSRQATIESAQNQLRKQYGNIADQNATSAFPHAPKGISFKKYTKVK